MKARKNVNNSTTMELYKYFIILQVMFAIRAHADFRLPIDGPELESFLNRVSSGNIDLKSRDGVYALPVSFKIFGKEDIKYVRIQQGSVFLTREPSDLDGFVLANYASFDKLIETKNLGDLLASISLPGGGDYWDVLAQSGTTFLKGLKSSHAGPVPIRFCSVKNSRLYFFSMLFMAKMTDESISNEKKPLGDFGPLELKIDGIDIIYAGMQELPKGE